MSDSVVVQAYDSILELVRGVEGYKSKTFEVYSDADIEDATKNITLPCAGIVYDGIKAISEQERATLKIGASAEIVFSVLIMFKKAPMASVAPSRDVINTLDGLRRRFRESKAPTGHKWRFISESMVATKANILVYAQRWSCPVQFV